MIFLKKIIGGTFQNITNRFEVFKFNALGLVVDDSIEVLIAQPKLDI